MTGPAAILQWLWRVDATIDNALLRDRRARAAVRGLRPQRGFFSLADVLFYSWGGGDPIGDHFANADNAHVRVMVLRNEHSPTAVWL